jgi:hypothetical protein
MTADQIRRSFVDPELALLERDGATLTRERSISLAAWETAAQLADINETLRRRSE